MAWVLKLLLCLTPTCLYLFVQGHLRNSPQLPAGLHTRWTPEAVCAVRLPPERASSFAALHRTPPGPPDVPVALLPLPKHQQEQVGMRYHQNVSERLIVKGTDQTLEKMCFFLAES